MAVLRQSGPQKRIIAFEKLFLFWMPINIWKDWKTKLESTDYFMLKYSKIIVCTVYHRSSILPICESTQYTIDNNFYIYSKVDQPLLLHLAQVKQHQKLMVHVQSLHVMLMMHAKMLELVKMMDHVVVIPFMDLNGLIVHQVRLFKDSPQINL